MKTIDICIFP